jgi:splicing factor, arginine/serine-rich 7
MLDGFRSYSPRDRSPRRRSYSKSPPPRVRSHSRSSPPPGVRSYSRSPVPCARSYSRTPPPPPPLQNFSRSPPPERNQSRSPPPARSRSPPPARSQSRSPPPPPPPARSSSRSPAQQAQHESPYANDAWIPCSIMLKMKGGQHVLLMHFGATTVLLYRTQIFEFP